MISLSSVSLAEHRTELLDSLDALATLAVEEKRGLTEDEIKQSDVWLAEVEEIDKTHLPRAQNFEAKKKAAAASRVSVSTPRASSRDIPPLTLDASGGKREFARPRQLPKSKYLSDEEAYFCASWFIALCEPRATAEAERFVSWAQDTGRPWMAQCLDYVAVEGGIQFTADAQTTDDNAKGGFLVPDPLAATIIDVRDSRGLARRLADMEPITEGDKKKVPKHLTGLTVYELEEDGSGPTQSEFTVAQVALSVKDRATLTTVSKKLTRASVISIMDRIATNIGYAFADQEDKEFFIGDASATYIGETGLTEAVGAAGLITGAGNSWGALTAANFETVIATLPERFFPGSVSWCCSRAFWNSVMVPITRAAGGVSMREMEDGPREFFFGYPVNFTSVLPTASAATSKCCIFGNYEQAAMIGDVQRVMIDTSDHWLFNKAQRAVMGSVAYDINVHEPGDGSNAGAYVVLQTAT